MEPSQERVVTIAYHVRWNPVIHHFNFNHYAIHSLLHDEGVLYLLNGLLLNWNLNLNWIGPSKSSSSGHALRVSYYMARRRGRLPRRSRSE